MPEQLQIVLLGAAIIVLLVISAGGLVALLQLRRDVDKFGKLLLKVRRRTGGRR